MQKIKELFETNKTFRAGVLLAAGIIFIVALNYLMPVSVVHHFPHSK
ncbi:MAG: hypothetical protein ACYCSQ_07540 [bacterium]